MKCLLYIVVKYLVSRLSNLDFNVSKLILITDTFGSLLGLDIVRNSIAKKIRVPDNLILIYPITELSEHINENLSIDGLSYSETINPFVNINKDLSKRLDITADLNILNKFPDTLIISPYNSPFKEYSENLYKFLKASEATTTFHQHMGYNKFCLQYPSLYENKSPVESAFGYFTKSLHTDNRRGSNLSTVPNSPNI
jgi:hypothetical protein